MSSTTAQPHPQTNMPDTHKDNTITINDDPVDIDTFHPRLLPEPPAKDTIKVDLSDGKGKVVLDELGPLVINSDGTLSRVANWKKMTDIEKQKTLRVLGKRNQVRRERLEHGGKGGE